MKAALWQILIVEDEDRLRDHLKIFFEDYDEYRVRSAASGEAALGMLAEERADVCIVDIRLPGMGGETFITMAAEAQLARRFLIHTGSVDLRLGEQLRSVGVVEDDIFFKPCRLEQLLKRLRELVTACG